MQVVHAVFFDSKGSLRNGWRILTYFVLLALVGLAANSLLHRLPGRVHGLLSGEWIGVLASLFAAWVCLRFEGVALTSIGLKPEARFLREVLLGTLGGLALMAVTACLVWALGGLHWVRTAGVGGSTLLKGAWFYLAVACFEEICFRGYPFQRAVQGLGFWGAQGVFALTFALVHWGNPGMTGATRVWATVNIGLAAVLLACCWRRTGSLALPIGVHLGWNWTQGNLLGFGVSGTTNQGWWSPVFQGRPEWLTGGAFGLEASLPCVLVCGAAILGLWAWKGNAPSAGASTASAS